MSRLWGEIIPETDRQLNIKKEAGVQFYGTTKISDSETELKRYVALIEDIEYLLQYYKSKILFEGSEITMKKVHPDNEKSHSWTYYQNLRAQTKPRKKGGKIEQEQQVTCREEFDNYLSIGNASNYYSGSLFLFGYRKSSELSSLPLDVIHVILNFYRLFIAPILVFGFHRGRAVGRARDSHAEKNASEVLIPAYTGSGHWNAGVTDAATLYLELYKPSIVRRIIISVRCFQTIQITAHRIGSTPRILLPTTESNLKDLDGTGSSRVIEFSFPNDHEITDYLEYHLVKGGNVSVHWTLVYGVVV